jgi:LPXTG-motif cell wall-anchored protein
MKKFIALLAILTLATYLTACTSNDKSADGDEVLDETAAVDQELENLEGDSTAVADSEASLDEQLPEDALGETESNAGDVAAAEEPVSTEGEQPPAPEIAAEDSTAGTGDSAVPEGFSAAPPDETGGFVDSGTEAPAPDVAASNDPVPETPAPSEPVAATEPVAPKPLLKVETAPFTRDGMLLNAVYIARPGDTFRSIASTIYGNPDKAADLEKANSWVSKPKPGTKLYYNSPQRPTDDQKLLTYYEDAGIPAEIYQAQPGENIRTIAKNLLGYDKAWQEVWATNPVESKSDISEPTSLRYWKAAPAVPPAMPSQDLAVNTPPPEVMPPTNSFPNDIPPPADMPPSDMGTGSMAANEFPPPADLPPPPADLPPPPPAEAINPPPPPPPVAKKAAPEEGGEAMDQDTIMIAGVGLVLLALVGLIIARKKRQQREMVAAFNDTQVGT